MKNLSLSVVNAGEKLKDIFNDVGKKISERKNHLVAESVLSEFKDPNKFLDETGKIKNPVQLQTEFYSGINKLLSVGKKDEAKGLASLFEGIVGSATKTETNYLSKNAVSIVNPELAPAFDNIDLNYADTSHLPMKSNKQTNSADKWTTVQMKAMRDFTNPETGENFPGDKIILVQSNGRGQIRYIPLGDNIPRESHIYSTNRSFGANINLNKKAFTHQDTGEFYTMDENAQIRDSKGKIVTGMDFGKLVPLEQSSSQESTQKYKEYGITAEALQYKAMQEANNLVDQSLYPAEWQKTYIEKYNELLKIYGNKIQYQTPQSNPNLTE